MNNKSRKAFTAIRRNRGSAWGPRTYGFQVSAMKRRPTKVAATSPSSAKKGCRLVSSTEKSDTPRNLAKVPNLSKPRSSNEIAGTQICYLLFVICHNHEAGGHHRVTD